MIYDCAIVGAGPAGSAAALYLSRAGHSVALIDRAAFPRRKACGEGILPAGVSILRELGVYEEAAMFGRALRGISYTTRDGREARSFFPAGDGLAMPREVLDDLLLRRAAAASCVRVFESTPALGLKCESEGVSVRLADGEVLARRLIVADGMSSPALKSLGVPRRWPERMRYGLSARLSAIEGLGDFVEVFLLDGGELYLTPLPGAGRATAALLLERRALADVARGQEAAFWRLVRSHPSVAPRLLRAVFDAPVIGLGPLAPSTDRCEAGPWLAAGDAAGAVDPLVGDGIGLALRSGRLAAEETVSALSGLGRPGDYTRRRHQMLRPKRRLASFALTMSRRPALACVAITALRTLPSLFSALLAD